jgi:uncharacterized protein YkwD
MVAALQFVDCEKESGVSRTTVAIRSLLLVTSALMLVTGCQENAASGPGRTDAAVVGFVTALPSAAATESSPTGTVTASTTVNVPTTTTSAAATSSTTNAIAAPPPAPQAPVEQPAPPAQPTLTEAQAQEARVVELTNAERATAGCPALVADDRLANSARGHSTDMATQNYFDHVSKDGRSFVDRIKAAGYPKPGAENIAAGQRTPESVMDGWMKSAGHRANILNCGLKAIGVGVAKGGSYGIYWTQNFGW